jgi:hypothetical protein
MLKTHAFLLAIACAAGAIAQDQPKNLTFGTTLKSVAVFRDGFGYYVREGKCKLENGWATTNFVPAAIRGTVYVYSLDPNDKIDTVVTTKENRIDFGSPKDIKGKLADKIGLQFTVETKNGQKFEGQLSKILDDMLLLQVGAAFNAVPYDQIKTITLNGFPIRVKVDTKDPNKVVTLGIAYLQEGIRWEPSYLLKIVDGKATLSLRATMQNTTEQLDKSDVLFVVGSPYVANRGIPDMIAAIAEGGGFGGAGGGVFAGRAEMGRGGNSQGVAADNAIINRPAPAPNMASITGEEAGELFFYTKQGLSLATGDIAMVSVLDSVVPITPTFEWNADGDEVNYLLSIKNGGKQPFTTGPVFVLEDGKAIGQELIRYTPPGASTDVRLSRGIGMRVEKTEAEIKRGAPVKVGKTEYIPVTMKGVLTISNYRTDKAPIKVTKSARGRVTSQSDDGKVKQTQVLTGDPNPLNDMEWKVTVAPGETKQITYTVEVLMSADRAGGAPIPSTPDGD